jgi:uncharacterized membrane protein YeiH
LGVSSVDISAEALIGVFDRVGIVAFAYSGVRVGMLRRLDVFGLLVIGIVSASGGGMMRDVVLGRLPLLLVREDYLLLAAAAAALAIPLTARPFRLARPVLALADGVGLGAFAVAGALAATEGDLGLPAVVALAVLNAVGGGVIRDLMVDRVPRVLQAEVQATAAAIGGATVWALVRVDPGLAALAGAGATALVRIGSRLFDIHLPVPKRDLDDS